jgi:RHS repeat-associated protein
MINQMAYNYQTGTNKLTHIGDFVADNAFTYDIDNQSANNYTYDAIGNLTQDVKGGLSSIAWNPYGKITQISKGTNGNLYYDYDAMGNRVKKNFTQSNDNADNTWYVRDASGNIMAIYSRKNYGTNQQVLLENYELYGSSRLGSLNLGIPVEGDYNLTPTTNYTRSLGLKQYELSNHLGNVLTTFSDQRVFAPAGMSSTNSNALIAKLISAQDYYPFGMIMDGRSWNTDKVKFGFNGKENDNEVKGIGNQQDYGMRIYDPRIGKFLRVDPLSRNYPYLSPYAFAENDVIRCIDLDGAEKLDIITDINVRNYPILRPDGSTEIIERAELLKVYVHTDNISDLTNGTQRTTVSGSVAGYELDGHRFRGTYIKGKFVGYEEDNDTKMIQPSVWKPEYYSIVESRSPHSAMKAFCDMSERAVLSGALMMAGGSIMSYSGFALSSTRTILTRASIDFVGQFAISGPRNIDYFDIAVSAFGGLGTRASLGALFDFRPFSQGSTFSVAGFNKDETRTILDFGLKYSFGKINSGLNGYLSKTTNMATNSLDEAIFNGMISIPVNWTGKATGKIATGYLNR